MSLYIVTFDGGYYWNQYTITTDDRWKATPLSKHQAQQIARTYQAQTEPL